MRLENTCTCSALSSVSRSPPGSVASLVRTCAGPGVVPPERRRVSVFQSRRSRHGTDHLGRPRLSRRLSWTRGWPRVFARFARCRCRRAGSPVFPWRWACWPQSRLGECCWCCTWLMLRTLPVALRLDLFVAFAAVIALGYTIRFMAPGGDRLATASMAPIAIVWLVLGYFSDDLRASAVQTAALVGGPVCLAACYECDAAGTHAPQRLIPAASDVQLPRNRALTRAGSVSGFCAG